MKEARRHVAAVVVFAWLLSPEGAGAEEARCETGATRDEFVARRGAIHAGASCDAIVVITDAAWGFSYGRVDYQHPVSVPFEVSVSVRRLTAERDRSIEVVTSPGTILVRDGEVGFYVSEAKFARDGWRAHPVETHRETRITVRVTSAGVEALVNGESAGFWPVAERVRPRDTVGLALKAEPGRTGQVRFRGFRVQPL